MPRIADTFHLDSAAPQPQPKPQPGSIAPHPVAGFSNVVTPIPNGLTCPHAYAAAELINRAFTWDKTREGGSYWQTIVSRLIQIANNGKL